MSWFIRPAKEALKASLEEKRPIPTGVKEFHEWSDRIISGAMLTATPESLKFALANIILNNLAPTVAFESDAYFINMLRKHAANQVADAMRAEIRDRVKARLALEEQQKQAAATAANEQGCESIGNLESSSV